MLLENLGATVKVAVGFSVVLGILAQKLLTHEGIALVWVIMIGLACTIAAIVLIAIDTVKVLITFHFYRMLATHWKVPWEMVEEAFETWDFSTVYEEANFMHWTSDRFKTALATRRFFSH